VLGAGGCFALTGADAQPTASPGFAAVLTRGYDSARSGWNRAETTLTQDAVRLHGIRRAYTLQMEGDARGCEASVLIVPNVMTPTGFRLNLAIQASMSDGLWAFNAETGEVVWAKKLGIPVKGTAGLDMFAINDNWGILGTPVIDPNTMIGYCVAWSSPDRSVANARYYAHAFNAGDGSPAAAPVDLTDVTFDAGHGIPQQTLGTIYRKQRTALLLSRKAVVVCFAAGAESAPTNHGWVLALSVSPFQVQAAWNDTPRYHGGGIWLAGGGPAADDAGNIYLATGNGSFDGATEFSESIVKLSLNGNSFSVAGNFAPFTDALRAGMPADTVSIAAERPRPAQMMLREPDGDGPIDSIPDRPGRRPVPPDAAGGGNGWTDQDLGSAGVLLIPSLGLLLSCGKDGIVYTLDPDAMGHTALADFASPEAIAANYRHLKQAFWFTFFPGWDASPAPTDLTKLNVDYAQQTHHQHSTPVYYESPVNGPMVFTCGENGPVRAWGIDRATKAISYLANSDEFASPNAKRPPGGMTGGMMTVSSNGNVAGTGLLAVTFPYGNANKEVTGGFLVVYDPEHFDIRPDGTRRLRPLWRSQDWNVQFTFAKFTPPVISGGRIFVPTYQDHVDVYTLAA
jgi:outer membrane protein assembly factor BamB